MNRSNKYSKSVSSASQSAQFASLRTFVREFDYPNPDWSNLPAGFPNLSKKGLTTQEGHLLDGIRLAWMASEGRGFFYQSLGRKTVAIAALIFVVVLGRNLLVSSSASITRTVSAKTVTRAVGDFVEATMSAVFRK